MRKMLAGLFIISSIFFGAAGCVNEKKDEGSSSKQVEKPVKEKEEVNETDVKQAFMDYLDQIRPIMGEHVHMVNTYEELRGLSANQKITDEQFASAIYSEILPMLRRMEEEFESTVPPREFRELHEKFIEMNQLNKQAMEKIVEAVKTGNFEKVNEANALFAESRKLDRELAYELEDLSKKYNVRLDMNNDAL